MNKKESLLSWDDVDRLLTVDAKNGKIYWKTSPCRWIHIGDEAGSKTGIGYTQIVLHQQSYYRHRLIWFYIHKKWPENFIDHINQVKGDDRIENLRLATKSHNMRNTKIGSRNTSGYKGVSWNKGRKMWSAEINYHKTIHLGHYPVKEAAALVYNVAANHLYGEFAYLNAVSI